MSPEPDSTAELVEDRVVSLAPAGQQSARPARRWVLVAAGLVVALGAVVVSARWSGPPLAAVASPSLRSGLEAPSPLVAATSQPATGVDTGPCGTGRVQLRPSSEPEPRQDVPRLAVPKAGLMALALEDSTEQGSILLASASDSASGSTAATVIATYTGADLQPGTAVVPIAWSADGHALLVGAGHQSSSAADESCSDLYLLRDEDGRVVAYSLTDDGWPGAATGGSLSSDGGRIAYFQENPLRDQNELKLIDVQSSNRGDGLVGCNGPLAAPRWSPDEKRILAICNNALVIADVEPADWHTFPTPSPDSLVLTAGWTADSRSIVVVAARIGQIASSPLEIDEIDAATGAATARAVSPTNTQWVVGSASMSPDGHWALVQGNDTYAIDTATGAATNLPWIVLPNPFKPATVAWLADGNSFLYVNSGTLYEVDLAAMTRTEVGAIPTSNFAWFESPR